MKTLDPAVTEQRCIAFIKRSFQESGKTKAIVGLSGGVDSAVVCTLAVRTLGTDNVVPVLLPCGALNTQGVLDAMELLQTVSFPMMKIVRIDIAPVMKALVTDPSADRVRRGNMMARVRMIYLFDLAKKYNGLVVGTENKTEHMLGYFTRYGDQASDVEPIIDLFKTQVFSLASHLGVPKSILTKPPSAELYSGQTDEGEFGLSYKTIDAVLESVESLGSASAPQDIAKAAGVELTDTEKVLAIVQANAFKTRVPYVPDTSL